MVKGISRQVIVVHSPDPKLFEQAIFILKDEAIGQEGVTNEALLKEANRLISGYKGKKRGKFSPAALFWAFGGAALTGAIWMLTILV